MARGNGLVLTEPENYEGNVMYKFEIYAMGSGQFRWRIRAGDGRVVATSGNAFVTAETAKRAARAVRDHITGARIDFA